MLPLDVEAHDASRGPSNRGMAMERRCRLRQTVTLEILEQAAPRLGAQAVKMPPGHEREIVLRKLREVVMACNLTGWINPPGLQPPT
jgi:hypothetical protein